MHFDCTLTLRREIIDISMTKKICQTIRYDKSNLNLGRWNVNTRNRWLGRIQYLKLSKQRGCTSRQFSWLKLYFRIRRPNYFTFFALISKTYQNIYCTYMINAQICSHPWVCLHAIFKVCPFRNVKIKPRTPHLVNIL